jgi:hypothetical protein
MGTGDSFGELALQEDNGKRSVTMRTEMATVLVVLSKRNYLRARPRHSCSDCLLIVHSYTCAH